MTRDNKGRFTDCGNPKGRPRKPRYIPPADITHHIERDDFFEVDNSPVLITVNGKPKEISVRRAIYQKLAYNAASGNIRAAIEWNKMRTRLIGDYVNEQLSMFAQITESEKLARDFPEDVTDRFLDVLQNLKLMLGPAFRA